jgi:hypothetical protein
MAKRSVSPGQQQTYRWRISQFRHRLEPLGDVEAPDEASAIAKAIGEYQITELLGGTVRRHRFLSK